MAADHLIVDLCDRSPDFIGKLAELTCTAFGETSPNWLPTLDAAREELWESLEAGRRSRVLVDSGEAPVGWIGATPPEVVGLTALDWHQSRDVG